MVAGRVDHNRYPSIPNNQYLPRSRVSEVYSVGGIKTWKRISIALAAFSTAGHSFSDSDSLGITRGILHEGNHVHLVLHYFLVLHPHLVRNANVQVPVIPRIRRAGYCAGDRVTLVQSEGVGSIEDRLPLK
jgi:hypothetical protein